MRSYYAHLKDTQQRKDDTGMVPSKPVFRASAIFPVIDAEGVTTRLIFLGYWLLKRDIKEVSCVTTLRNTDGTILSHATESIHEAKTYKVELKAMLQAGGLDDKNPFFGSLEIEFFSAQPLVFPYPAVSINYYGPQFSSVVHTTQRIYNDIDDMKANTQIDVPESGFNIYSTDEIEPFIGLVNGPESVPDSIMNMTFINSDNETLVYQLPLGDLEPYATRFIYPSQHVDLKSFLKGKVGTVKINYNVKWIYPRLLVGNINRTLPGFSITHSYYDCTKAVDSTDYWLPKVEGWHSAALMLPAKVDKDHYTNIYFYPIYSPSSLRIDIEVYEKNGGCLGKKENAVKISTSKQSYFSLSVQALCNELKIDLNKLNENDLGIRVIANSLDAAELIPTRIKISLDIGCRGRGMPCNICTNLILRNPGFTDKTRSFRWAPILADTQYCSAWILNSSPQEKYTEEATLELTFYNENDTQTLMRTVTVPPFGFIVIDLDSDPELRAFFGGKIGWFTMQTNNPYISTYYFTESISGVVGGDHSF